MGLAGQPGLLRLCYSPRVDHPVLALRVIITSVVVVIIIILKIVIIILNLVFYLYY